MNQDELNSLILNYIKRIDEYKIKDKELEYERNKFVNLFPKEKILDMTIDQYVTGNQSEDSFCYLIERKLRELGSILGGPIQKFKVYYSNKRDQYESTQGYDSDYKVAFEMVKQVIYDLLAVHQAGDMQKVREIDLSITYKGKILATYFPDECLNIFHNGHLDYFLARLRINYSLDADEFDKRKLLLEFKSNNEYMKKWSAYLFMKFLYTDIGNPRYSENIPSDLEDYNEVGSDYPDLRLVEPEIIQLEMTNEYEEKESKRVSMRKIDFELENKRKRVLGFRGEKIVEKYERKFLEENGKTKLTKKINIVSMEDDSLGYDIISYNIDGTKKYIEVKSTTRSPSKQIQFNLSNNQINVAKELDNYWIYVVFEARNKKPKIWRIFNPFNDNKSKIRLKPINYKAIINIIE